VRVRLVLPVEPTTEPRVALFTVIADWIWALVLWVKFAPSVIFTLKPAPWLTDVTPGLKALNPVAKVGAVTVKAASSKCAVIVLADVTDTVYGLAWLPAFAESVK